MPTPKQLVINALTRTTREVIKDSANVPAGRWQDVPAGRAKSLREVLKHLIECEGWWLVNIGVPREERPPLPDLSPVQSPEEMVGLFRAAREHLMGVVRGLPESFFDNRVPTSDYEDLETGADLLLYTAEHDYYHDGQIQMLELAFAEG